MRGCARAKPQAASRSPHTGRGERLLIGQVQWQLAVLEIEVGSGDTKHSTTIIDNGDVISTFPVHCTGQNETHLSAIEAHA